MRAARERLDAHWRQRLERARYEAQRAERQDVAVEPENRLVARERERRGEEALRQEQQVQEDQARFQREPPPALTPHEREMVRRLAQDVPALWAAPQPTPQDRQAIVRLLIERVTIDVQGDSAQVAVTLQGAGGISSGHRLRRPVARYEQLSHSPELWARIEGRCRAGHSLAKIAAHLNLEGLYPPKRPERFTGETVARLRSRRGLPGPRPRAMVDASVLRPEEYWWADWAPEVTMPIAPLHTWQRVGGVHHRKVAVAAGRWAIWADADELERRRQLRAYQRTWPEPRSPPALTTPPCRDMQQ